MIFLQLLYTFLLIGAFTFGGGYSMIVLIQDQVVNHHGWMTTQEFADLLAVSQTTPGPVGINTATYAGYTAVLNAGYPHWTAILGALLASLAVITVPVALVLLVSRWLLANKDKPQVAATMRTVRLAVIGLIAAAALGLMPMVLCTASTGNLSLFNHQFSIINILIFVAVFILSWRYKKKPVMLILASGLVGLILF